MRNLLITLGVLAAGILILYAATLSQASFECEACMELDGRRSCRTVVGPTREDAQRGAISNACATLTRGVTQTLRCEGQAPQRLVCRER